MGMLCLARYTTHQRDRRRELSSGLLLSWVANSGLLISPKIFKCHKRQILIGLQGLFPRKPINLIWIMICEIK